MLDFLSRGANKKGPEPFAGARGARAWIEETMRAYGSDSHGKLCELLGERGYEAVDVCSPATLEALLEMDSMAHQLHEQLMLQYLMNNRMPKVVEANLRNQVLNYGHQFLEAYLHFLNMPKGQGFDAYMPQLLARCMHYYGEQALWRYFTHAAPDEVFWLNVNQLYQFAERNQLEAMPVFLFGEEAGGTTVQDQFLIVQMLFLLSNGNFSPRQWHFAHQVLNKVSRHLEMSKKWGGDGGFVVELNHARPARRCQETLSNGEARYWSSMPLAEIFHGWLVQLDSGKAPAELRALIGPGVDPSVLRLLARDWAPQPVHVNRAERLPVKNRRIEVAARFSSLHKLLREGDEKLFSRPQMDYEKDTFVRQSEMRIYGFISSRNRERPLLANSPAMPEPKAVQHNLPTWQVEDASQTGLGVSLSALGNDWVTLGALIGFRDVENDDWSLAIIRRIRREVRERIFVGIELLSERPVAATIKFEDKTMATRVPPEFSWLGGYIAVFIPLKRGDKTLNTVLMPLSAYSLGRQVTIAARGKQYVVAMSKVLEKGGDWCLVEVDPVGS